MESSCLINDPFWFILIIRKHRLTFINQHLCSPLYRNRQPKLRNVRSNRQWEMEREAREMQANAEHTAHLAIWRSLAKVNRGERKRASLGIGWPLGSLVVSGITLFPRTSSSSSRVRHWPTLAAREARIGKGYITFCSTYNEARA